MKNTQKKQIELSVTDDPTLAQFEDARAEICAFMETHNEVFTHFAALADVYNTTLEAAEQTVRAKATEYEVGVNCGPFKFKNFRTVLNADKLHELVGDDKFLAIGGKIETVPSYSVDKAVFLAKVAGKFVSEDIKALVLKTSPVYSAPDKINIL